MGKYYMCGSVSDTIALVFYLRWSGLHMRNEVWTDQGGVIKCQLLLICDWPYIESHGKLLYKGQLSTCTWHNPMVCPYVHVTLKINTFTIHGNLVKLPDGLVAEFIEHYCFERKIMDSFAKFFSKPFHFHLTHLIPITKVTAS